jgi:putative hydrolase of the HAD superfamily
MQKIKNIIFDLGGIFIDIDFDKTENAFAQLGLKNFHNFFSQHSASPLFEDLETGKITPSEFYNTFRNQTQTSLTDNQIESAWNALLGNFPSERIEWLIDIKQRYNVYLFSNTNIIHYNAFQDIYRKNTGLTGFDELFVKAHYSHQIGYRKPYPESFTALLQLENLLPQET